MNNIPELYDLVEYELYNENYARVVIPEPIGWKDDLVQLKRSQKNFTTITKYMTNLEFVGEGADFITQVYSIYGFEAKIILTKRRVHPVKMEVETRYIQILDGYTYQLDDGKVKINSVESDLMAKINGYKDEEVELIRTTSLDGVEIPSIQLRDATIDGKQIELVSKWGISENDNPYVIPFGTGNEIEYMTFHMDQIANSDDQTFAVTNPRLNNGNDGLPISASTQNLFYAIALDDKELDLSIDVAFDFRRNRPGATDMSDQFFVLYLLTFYDDSINGNSQYRYLSREALAIDDGVTSVAPDGKQVKTLSYKGRAVRELKKGQSWALAVYGRSYDKESVLVNYNKIDLQIVEDSLVEPTQQKVIYVYDAIEQLLRIMTGETTPTFVSNYFGRKELGYEEDGEGAYMTICSGFMARQFNDRPLSTTFEDMMNSLFAVLNVSYSFEKQGFKEFIRVEPLSYFFTNKRYVFSKKVASKDIKLSVSKEFSMPGIEIGYERGGDDYEEAVGLDEYNGLANWLTPLSKASGEFSRVSTYRADSTGLEFARRKPQLNFPTEDTDYDDDVFLLDMKLVGNALKLRTWQDDFATPPENIYNPETAYNLRFSPIQMFKRHSYMFNSALDLYKNKVVSFGSMTGNSQLTQDGIQLRSDIPISDLDPAKFKNVTIEFKLDTDYYDEQAILDNIYGIFEFSNEKGQIFQFRLFDFKQDKYKGLLINGIQ